jgi:hypothetical protein
MTNATNGRIVPIFEKPYGTPGHNIHPVKNQKLFGRITGSDYLCRPKMKKDAALVNRLRRIPFTDE